MLETSARLLRLLSLLQTRKDWSGPELADRLGVTGRTVRRDVEKLRGLGYPVHASSGITGGYQLGAGAALPPLLLDDEEAVAVAVGLRTAAGGAITGIEESSVRALAKLEQVLPARLRRRVNTLQTFTVRVQLARPGPTVAPDLLASLSAACRDRELLRFDYADHAGVRSRREAEPHRLVNWGRRWYLVAWDTQRRDWRIFRVDRLSPRVPTGPRFPPRELPEPDLAAYVSRRVSSAAWRVRAEVLVRAPASVMAERINSAVGVVEPVDEDTCVVRVGADTAETLAVYLSLMDADFEVTEPPEVVAHLRKLADRYRAATARASAAPPRSG